MIRHNKTILVTGGAGYIGSHTSLLLQQKGYNVIVLDKLVYNQSFNHAWCTFIKGDFGDKELLQKIFSMYEIHAVMHFGAFIEVGKSVTAPLSFYENNVAKTITLLQMMQNCGINYFIFSSSCAVYGIPDAVPLDEEHPKRPISPYGSTKLMIEQILNDLSKAYSFAYVALRYFNAAGLHPGFSLIEPHKPETHVIPLLIRAAVYDKPFYIFGTDYETPDGTCIRDYLHVWDIAHAHYQALDYLMRGGDSVACNLGTGKGYSILELIRTVEKCTHKTVRIIKQTRRPGDPAMLVAQPQKACSTLKWQPICSSLEYIVQTVLGLCEQHEGLRVPDEHKMHGSQN